MRIRIVVLIMLFGFMTGGVFLPAQKAAAALPIFPFYDWETMPKDPTPPDPVPDITPGDPLPDDPEDSDDVLDNRDLSFPENGMVSFAFDDGLLTTYTEALPILESYGLRGTAYVYPDAQQQKARGGGYEDFMSWEQVQSLQDDYDWEIGHHTLTHAHMTQISRFAMRREMWIANRYFRRHGIDARGFASPYGEYDDSVLSLVSRTQVYHRNAFGGTFNDFSSFNEYNINAVEVAYDMTPAEAELLIDEARAENKWLILYWHDLIGREDDPEPYTYTVDDFTEIVAYVAQQPVMDVTVREGVDIMRSGENLVSNGDFEAGKGFDAVGWTRSHPRRVRVMKNHNGNAPFSLRSVRLRGYREQVEISSSRFAVSPGEEYTLSAFMKMRRFVLGGGNFWISEFDASGDYIGGKWVGGVFQNFVGSKYMTYIPNPDTRFIEIFIYAEAGSSFVWYVDDVSLRKVSSPSP